MTEHVDDWEWAPSFGGLSAVARQRSTDPTFSAVMSKRAKRQKNYAPFSFNVVIDLRPGFQGHDILEVEYRRNRTS